MRLIRAADKPLTPASHEDPANPGVLKRVLCTASDFQAGHVQMVNWAELPPSRSFQPHYHEDMQELFVLFSGKVSMEVSGSTMVLEPGDAVLVEPGEVHIMRNLFPQSSFYFVLGVSSGKGGKTVNV